VSLAITLTVGVDAVNSPFPPNYPAGGNGFEAAGSNPNGGTAGSIVPSQYYGANILAIANDSASAPTQFLVAIAGTPDQAFLGQVTTPDGKTYAPTAATFVTYAVNGSNVTFWIWPLAAGGSALANGTVTFADTGDTDIVVTAAAISSTEIDLTWTNSGPVPPSNYYLYRGIAGVAPTLYQTLGGTTYAFNDSGLTANTQYQYYVTATYADGTHLTGATITVFTPQSGISATFNCNCESQPLPADGWTIDSLANLRARVAIRTGYAAQATNLPAGKKAEINEYLRSAQNQLYRNHKEFRGERLYAWQMEPNIRYYGFSQDESGCRTMDPLSVTWVGFEDLNQAWYKLIEGIDPVLYTRAQISNGWPTHFEMRSCIEIFPAPKAPYTLWVKGRFGLDPFTADANNTTIDAESVYLLASGMMLMHYGKADGQAVLTQASNYVKYLVAAAHRTRRYVPRTKVQTPWTPPNFLPLSGIGPE
jgi:hypothetical protein